MLIEEKKEKKEMLIEVELCHASLAASKSCLMTEEKKTLRKNPFGCFQKLKANQV